VTEPTGIPAISLALRDRLAAAAGGPDGTPVPVEIVAPVALDRLPGEPARLALVLQRVELGAARAARPTPFPGIPGPGEADLVVDLHYVIVVSAVVELDAQAVVERVLRAIEGSPIITVAAAGATPVRLVVETLQAADQLAFWRTVGIPPRLALFITASATLAPPALPTSERTPTVRTRTRPPIDR
jgi:hypothetical protein